MRATPRDAPRPRHPRSPQKLADGAGSRGALATFPASFGTPGAGRCPSPVARGAGHRSGRAARGYHPAGVALVKAGHTRRGDHAARLFLTPAPPAPSAPRSRGFGPGAARAGRGRVAHARHPLAGRWPRSAQRRAPRGAGHGWHRRHPPAPTARAPIARPLAAAAGRSHAADGGGSRPAVRGSLPLAPRSHAALARGGSLGARRGGVAPGGDLAHLSS